MKYWILAAFVECIVLFYSVPSHVFSQVPSLYAWVLVRHSFSDGGIVLSITQGQTNNTPQTSLISGDVNGDNKLDIQDYNGIVGCFGTKQCDKKQLADLTDDGNVDGIDLLVVFSAKG